MAHECPECGETCYCDLEDHDTGEAPIDCAHGCNYENEEDYEYEN